MKKVLWNGEKNLELKRTRGVLFEELLNSRFLGIEVHPKRTNQKLMLFELDNYIWVVPYVEDECHYFLKTAFPSRKHTAKYLGGKK
ncbi:MAG: toxin [Candidatus Omnitrophica bacterium]|nr:toxin [Candidatus Omnitrophota bacterium]